MDGMDGWKTTHSRILSRRPKLLQVSSSRSLQLKTLSWCPLSIRDLMIVVSVMDFKRNLYEIMALFNLIRPWHSTWTTVKSIIFMLHNCLCRYGYFDQELRSRSATCLCSCSSYCSSSCWRPLQNSLKGSVAKIGSGWNCRIFLQVNTYRLTESDSDFWILIWRRNSRTAVTTSYFTQKSAAILWAHTKRPLGVYATMSCSFSLTLLSTVPDLLYIRTCPFAAGLEDELRMIASNAAGRM